VLVSHRREGGRTILRIKFSQISADIILENCGIMFTGGIDESLASLEAGELSKPVEVRECEVVELVRYGGAGLYSKRD
jgi:hypothetical protein